MISGSDSARTARASEPWYRMECDPWLRIAEGPEGLDIEA